MKYYKVQILAFTTVIVEASSEDEATEIAVDEANFRDFEMDEAATKEEVPEAELPNFKRHYKVIPYES